MRQKKTLEGQANRIFFKRKGENHRVRIPLIFNKATYNECEQQWQSANLVNVSFKTKFHKFELGSEYLKSWKTILV